MSAPAAAPSPPTDAAGVSVLERMHLAPNLAWSRTPFLSTGIAVIVLGILPLLWRNDYIISLLTLIFIYTIFTQSWNITIGFCGIWNFGQLAIIALGGYASGLLTVKVGLSPWLALPVGVIAGGVVAIIMVLPSIKLRGIYASMLTFAFAEVVRLLIVADSTGFTGGVFGLTGVRGLFDGLSPEGALRAYYWFALFLAAVIMLLMHRMMNSPFGMGLVSLRESIRFSIGMGIDRRVQFIAATAISGLIAGLGGAVYACYYHAISPSIMGLAPMGLFVTMVVVGGLGTVRGPIIGVFVVMIISEALRDAGMWRLVVQGALLLIVLAFVPAGVDGLLSRGFSRVKEWMNVEKPGGAAAEGVGAPPDGAAVATATTAAAEGSAAVTAAAGAACGPPAAVAGVAGAACGSPTAAAGEASPPAATEGVAEAKPKKGGFKAWLNADQPQGGQPAKKPKEVKPAKAVKPKSGGFKAWLNADQPPKDEKK